ncbi:MAG: hypothetical protein RMX65_023920 [Nostoc sp. DedQUE01]|nr:hypothetical protein [Nostoc sp. DedQUE01]
MTKDFVAVVSSREAMSYNKPLRVYAPLTLYQTIKFPAQYQVLILRALL